MQRYRKKYLDEMIHRIDDASRRGSGVEKSGGLDAWPYASYIVVLEARIRKWRDPRSN